MKINNTEGRIYILAKNNINITTYHEYQHHHNQRRRQHQQLPQVQHYHVRNEHQETKAEYPIIFYTWITGIVQLTSLT